MIWSPCAINHQDGAAWVLWVSKSPVLELLEKPTDSLRAYDCPMPAESCISPATLQPTGIERHRYQAVMKRMHQAAGRAGTFSEWNKVNT